MNEGSFKKLDESLMNDLKAFRKKKLPQGILEGFAESVRNAILEKQEKALERTPSPLRWPVPVLVPALAVLIIGFVVVSRGPAPTSPSLEIALNETEDLSQEIAILMELGEWGPEDEADILIEEETYEDLELSRLEASSYHSLA